MTEIPTFTNSLCGLLCNNLQSFSGVTDVYIATSQVPDAFSPIIHPHPEGPADGHRYCFPLRE